VGWGRTGHLPAHQLVMALLLLAGALRVYGVGRQALRGDEAFSISFALQPLGDIFRAMANTEPNPPLYWLVLRGWLGAAGQSELAARWPSVLAGLLAVALTYRLGRALAGRAAGLLGMFLTAISPFLIWYAQDARVYSLLVALIAAAMWQTWRAARLNRWTGWLAAAGLWWLALFAHYFAAFAFLSVVAAVLLAPATRARWKSAGLMTLGVGLAYLPWAGYVGPLLAGHSKGWILPLGFGEALWRSALAASIGAQTGGVTQLVQEAGAVWLALLVALGAVMAFRRHRDGALWLLAVGLGPPLELWLLSVVRPAFTEQYLIGSWPMLLILAAAGLAALARAHWANRWPGWIATAGWSLLVLFALQNYFFNPADAKSPNWRGVVDYLAATVRPSEVIVINLPDPAFNYYYRGPAPVENSPPAPMTVAEIPATEAQLQRLRDDYEHIRFFFSPSPGYDPEGFVGKWLDGCCEKLSDIFVYNFRVQTFDTPAGSLAARTPYPLEFADGIGLTGYRVANPTPHPGEAVHLTLYWTARSPIKPSYTVFVHLLAPDGFNVAGADGLPRGGQSPTDQWALGEMVIDAHLIALPADFALGHYMIEVGLYQLATGERLVGRDSAGQTADHFVLPSTVDVVGQ
jgi:mannosyltransferase